VRPRRAPCWQSSHQSKKSPIGAPLPYPVSFLSLRAPATGQHGPTRPENLTARLYPDFFQIFYPDITRHYKKYPVQQMRFCCLVAALIDKTLGTVLAYQKQSPTCPQATLSGYLMEKGE